MPCYLPHVLEPVDTVLRSLTPGCEGMLPSLTRLKDSIGTLPERMVSLLPFILVYNTSHHIASLPVSGPS